jgi:hypothetical protein
MPRIRIDDLPAETLTPEQMEQVFGAGRGARPALEALERREVPTTGVTSSLSPGGALLVQGTAGADNIRVAQAGGQVVVKDAGHVVGSYAAGRVTSITVNAGAGDDYVWLGNLPAVAITVRGQAGNDAIYGGSQAESLFGGAGNDYLSGGGGDDVLDGGAGNDYLVGGTGVDTFVGGAGWDRYQPDGNDVYADLDSGLYGAIAAHYYNDLPGETTYNGTPVPDALGQMTADEHNVLGVPGARVTDFQHGAIYWSPGTGANVIYGEIWDEYKETQHFTNAQGVPVKQVLGLPTTDELDAGHGGVRVSHFQGGDIYWRPGLKGGAFCLYGAIRHYFNHHGALGRFGVPTSTEADAPGGRIVHFEHGSLFWDASTGVVSVV